MTYLDVTDLKLQCNNLIMKALITHLSRVEPHIRQEFIIQNKV